MTSARAFPDLLARLHALEFYSDDEDSIEFEPYQSFVSAEKTDAFIRAWTGNKNAEGSAYLIFGQDGSGGYAAFWTVEPGRDLLEQPIVFFGCGGELGVIAENFSDYLWLLASGHGPIEAVSDPDEDRSLNEKFTAFAQQHATTPRRSMTEILASARAKYPEFERDMQAQSG